LFLPIFSFAQHKSVNKNELIEKRVEYLIEAAEESDVDYSTIFDHLTYYFDHPLNLHRARLDDLEALGLLTSIQINNLLKHINTNGKLMTLEELQTVDGFDVELTAKNIIIATGGRSKVLPGLEQDGEKVIGYRDALALKDMPKKMVIVGSGAIGVEFAYFYNAMGTEVTIIEYMDRILPREDKDISREVTKAFKKKGIKIITKSAVQSVDTSGANCQVKIATNKDGAETIIECDKVLSAVGVTPNTENIGLEEVGIKTDRGLLVVDDFYQTNVEGYFAIGDILPTQALAHVASAEGIICVEKIAGQNPEPLDYGNIPGCTYCIPEVASVGMTEEEAKEAGYELKIGKFPLSASGKAAAAGAKEGFVKVIYDAKYGEWLGAHMVGYNVTEMIAEVIVARKLETTGHEILKSVHPHPTISEAIMEATAAAYGEVIHL
jgi:dihydrolipoamide dehydrogenase